LSIKTTEKSDRITRTKPLYTPRCIYSIGERNMDCVLCSALLDAKTPSIINPDIPICYHHAKELLNEWMGRNRGLIIKKNIKDGPVW